MASAEGHDRVHGVVVVTQAHPGLRRPVQDRRAVGRSDGQDKRRPKVAASDLRGTYNRTHRTEVGTVEVPKWYQGEQSVTGR